MSTEAALLKPTHGLAQILSLRKKRLSLQREVDLLEQQEKELISGVINSMNQNGLTVLKEGDDEVELITTQEPVANDWAKIVGYVIANDAVDLLQKRLAPSAVKARWADGVTIPGIDKMPKQTLKFNV